MLPLPESLLERSFNSQLELNSPASTQNTIAHPINFSFSYPNQTSFMLDGFQLPYPDHQLYNDPMNNTTFDLSRTNNNTQSPNSRSGKRVGRKDRHSKIHTAMGLRDRRMRLSREVAHKFFGLQDMLGFDKASKTVQWLLTKSKTAIREITGGSKGMHSNNGNTGCPNNGDCPNSDSEDASTVSDNKLKMVSELEKQTKVKKLGNVKAPRKANVHQTLDKEARAKARERARERTKEKQRLHTENLVSSVRLKGIIGEESSSHGYTNYSSSNLINEIEEGSSTSVINERAHDYTIGSESNEIPVFNYACSEYGGMNTTDYTYQDQWGIEGSFFGPMQYQ